MVKELITVVVPVYNVEQYLDRCLESIVGQTYENLEIILVDDESPDNCPQLCEEWAKKDSRIKVIHKKNQGLGMARNTGIDNATGAYICFVDSDDYVEHDMVEQAYSEAKKEDAQVVIYGMIKEDGNKKVISTQLPNKDRLVFSGEEVKTKFMPAKVSNRQSKDNIESGLSCCALLISKRKIDETGWRLVSEREILSEDIYSLIRFYSYVDKIVVMPKLFYHYCQNEGTLTKVYRQDRFDKIIEFHDKTAELIKECKYPQSVMEGLEVMCFSFIIGLLKTIVNSNLAKKDKIKEFKKVVKDKRLKKLIGCIDIKNQKKSWKVLMMTMRLGLTRICYILVKSKS